MSRTLRCWLSSVLAAAAVALIPALVAPASAGAPRVVGGIDYAVQTSPSTMVVSGWAIDLRHRSRSLGVNLRLDGTWERRVVTNVERPGYNADFHASGRHGFVVTMGFQGGVRSGSFLGLRWDRYVGGKYIETLGSRIVQKASEYVGYPYVYGGASPSGFDCSGFSQYVYNAERAGGLVHNAEDQRRQVRAISASEMRPGDLIFYMSGNYAYHVAIYSGGGGAGLYQGWEYSASTPSTGVVHDQIWSTSVRFGTTWHWSR